MDATMAGPPQRRMTHGQRGRRGHLFGLRDTLHHFCDGINIIPQVRGRSTPAHRPCDGCGAGCEAVLGDPRCVLSVRSRRKNFGEKVTRVTFLLVSRAQERKSK